MYRRIDTNVLLFAITLLHGAGNRARYIYPWQTLHLKGNLHVPAESIFTVAARADNQGLWSSTDSNVCLSEPRVTPPVQWPLVAPTHISVGARTGIEAQDLAVLMRLHFCNPIFRGGKVLRWAEILAHNYLVMAERRGNGSQPTEKTEPALSLLVAVCSCAQRLREVREIPEEWAWHEQHALEMDTDVSGIFLRSLWSKILNEIFSVIGHKCKCSIHYGGYLWFAFCINTEIQCRTLQFPCFRLSSVNTFDK